MRSGRLARRLERERDELLERILRALELPMLVLAFVWLALFVVEVLHGGSPVFDWLGWTIWAAFLLEFVLGLLVAPRKLAFLRSNWLKAIALLLPALRVLRVAGLLRAARLARLARFSGAVRGARLVRLVSSLNRGMRALGASMGRRGFGYVVVLTLIATFAGAAGMLAFEREAPDGSGLRSYGDALWWTAMLMTTMGSEWWPRTTEGRLLCLLLAAYAFAVFGYVTATLATFFVGRDAADERGELVGAADLRALRSQLAAISTELAAMRAEHGAWRSEQGDGNGEGRRAAAYSTASARATARPDEE